MRQTILPQHSTLFVKQGWILFEGALSQKACKELKSFLPLSIRNASFGAWVKKYQVMEWLYELTGRDPLRVIPLASFQPKDLITQVDLLSGNLTYHTECHAEWMPHQEEQVTWVCTDRYLDPIRYPLIFRRGG